MSNEKKRKEEIRILGRKYGLPYRWAVKNKVSVSLYTSFLISGMTDKCGLIEGVE